MNKLILGILLILMMFGHNYVLNQPQVLQLEFQEIHNITVPQFNLLYSLPSAIAIFFILPLGMLYDKYSEKIVIGSGAFLVLGQLLVTVFGTSRSSIAFPLLNLGRIFQGTSAEVLYMIQANLSSSWMGKLAGLTLILPEVGQIANVFLTLEIREKFSVLFALEIGFFTCIVSLVACIYLYGEIRKHKKVNQETVELMVNSPQSQEEKDTQMSEEQYPETRQLQAVKSINQTARLQPPFLLPEAQSHNAPAVEAPKSILKAGKVFWLVVVLCAINECLYFPFLDNAKVLIQSRFCVPQDQTSFYLCLPYLSAITLSILVGEHILYRYSREKLIFVSSLLPLLGHSIIYFINNCETETTIFQEILLVLGFMIFGMGIAGYYSISMPAVGLAVPESIRGTAFACLGFMQTLTMTAVPLISGQIIEQDSVNNDNFVKGYRNSSFFFVFLCISASVVSFIIMMKADSKSFQYCQEQDMSKQEITKSDQNSQSMEIEPTQTK